MAFNIEDFIKQADCVYKEEHYSVRDNGAVYRHARENKLLRKHDNQWTFGIPNNKGYLLLASEVVHRIVAYAFLGEPPTLQHVIDHIDTNRQNNRPENLRWLTKLENILNNPITVKRIVFRCGSIEAFLKDPTILKAFEAEDPNFKWMKAVTPEEAEISWKRLISWANKETSKPSASGAILGDWIFQKNENSYPVQSDSEFVDSLTPNAVQRNWKTPCEFLLCPQIFKNNPIVCYANNLKIGDIFSRNQYSDSIVSDFATSFDEATMWVICKNSNDSAVKPWSLAKVSFEDNLFVHTNLGSYFDKVGAEKKYTLAQGLEWTGGDTFEDFC